MGVLKLLTWVFAGLFVACGLPLFLAEDPGWRNAWGGLSLIGATALERPPQGAQDLVAPGAHGPRLRRHCCWKVAPWGAGKSRWSVQPRPMGSFAIRPLPMAIALSPNAASRVIRR